MALETEIEDINWSEPFETSEETAPIPEDCIKLLLDSFGHSQFRKMQWKIISSILHDARDNCVIMATGYGKSLCFQFPSVYRNTITIVVSPLISLMQDQVTAMCFNKLKACFLGSAQTNRDTVYEVIDRQYNIVYVTPEYITSESGALLIDRIKDDLALIAIDEAHCISKWGHDFRSAYRSLSNLRNWCPSVPILAMTATATNRVRDDIIHNLRLNDPQIISTGFDRPNLEFIVQAKTDVWNDIGKYINNVKIGSIIVYCITRRKTEEVAHVIAAHGHLCGVYHAGLPLKNRQKTHEEFIHDRTRVVVATVAFGMGINKPDVRLVIHYGVSKDIEGYYQEVGRAGRDGLPAKCLLFHQPKDFSLHRMICQKSNPYGSTEQAENLMIAIRQYVNTKECRRCFILSYFGEDCHNLSKRANCCDNCNRSLTGPVAPVNLYSKYQGLDVDGLLDITEETQYLLQLLQDMSRFGLRKAILVLRGSKSKDVPSSYNTHHTFGKLKHRSDKWLQAVVNSLVDLNILTLKDVHEAKFTYTRCLLTNKGKVWLSGIVEQTPIKVVPGEEFIRLLSPRIISAPKILFPLFVKKEENQPSTSVKPPVPTTPSISLPNNVKLSSPSSTKSDIYRPLLKVRSKLASLFDVMPYLVASTKALEQLAKIQPTTMEELRTIRLDGYSEEKTQRFGPVFLKVIRDHQAKLKKTSNEESETAKEQTENKNPEAIKIKEEVDRVGFKNNNNLPSQTENDSQSPAPTQSSIEVIEPPTPQVIEIESDIENAIFNGWDSDDSELTSVGNKVEEQLNASGATTPPKSENEDLDLLIDALKSEDLSQAKPEILKQSRMIEKKPTNELEYESDSGSDIFEADWDLEIDESDLNKISQQAEEKFKCDSGILTATPSTTSSNDFAELKPIDVKVKTAVSNSQKSASQSIKQERKPRIIERKVSNVFEYEDDSDSDSGTKPVASPKKRILPSWMQAAQKRKR